MAHTISDVIARGELNADVATIIPQLRTIYAQAKGFLALTARFSDPAFDDAFTAIAWFDDFDGTVGPSNMILQVSNLVAAWEANPTYRAVLGI